MQKRIGSLGDIRAEHDRQMLELAFYETPDYRTLLESTDRPIVVGRRGTGKSALSYQLKKYWKRGPNTTVIEIVPEEDQVFGIRHLLPLFGTKYTQLKAGAKIVAKYALLVEAAASLVEMRKISTNFLSSDLAARLKVWRNGAARMTGRFRELLRAHLTTGEAPEATIAGLAQKLQLDAMQLEIRDLLAKCKVSIVFLIDQLDEGFEPDEIGLGFVGGFVHAAVDVNNTIPGIHTNIFLRDNIFKALAHSDPDYSKNIEGRFLRLHWDENQLFQLVCARLRIMLNITQEDGDRKVWNRCTANELQGKDGFEKCLRLTLYRPRDLLSLLNEAFHAAQRQNRTTLILKDVEITAREISNTRFEDLLKEYSAIVPSLKVITAAFRGKSPELTYEEVRAKIDGLRGESQLDAASQRDLAIMEQPEESIRLLYSIGFLGIKDSNSSAFIFCHDGRSPNKEFALNDRLLVHPCYWIALDLIRNTLTSEEAADIHDEYEVEIFSEAKEIRKKRIGQLIAKLDKLVVGAEDASSFEDWCLKAVRICFSGPLRNIELHPNKDAPQRRDIIASNQSEKGAWRRVLDDYRCRQVIFEVKNKLGIDPTDYRQMLSYLHDDYGRLGFIITRDSKPELYSGPELDWTREMFNKHKVLIIKITGSLLSSLLSKLRGAERFDPAEHKINKLLDTYTRLYLSGARIAPQP